MPRQLSIVIPAYNEAENLIPTVTKLHDVLAGSGIDHEIVVVNDSSRDNSLAILTALQQTIPTLVFYTNTGANGFGYAVRFGLDRFKGQCVALFMADMSDDPDDLVRFYRKMEATDADCVFGNRWAAGGKVIDYPSHKYWINRVANYIIRLCFQHGYNDTTNAFKLYKREVIEGIKPFLSPHFNLTIELPLKAIIRGFSFTIVPNSWTNRQHGTSNLKIREMGSRYFFILLYCLIEKFFSRGDYKKR